MGKIFLRNLSMREILVMTSRTSFRLSAVQTVGVEVGEEREPLGMGLFGQFSLARSHVEALHLKTRVSLAGNHISDEQRDKEQESRRKAKEHERGGDEI